jgi:hypothetical protein
MANALYYWDGKAWQPISSGGGGAPGPAGPAGPQGPAGESVNVFVQITEPEPIREGDFWIEEAPPVRMAPKKYPTLDDLKKYPTLDDLERMKKNG